MAVRESEKAAVDSPDSDDSIKERRPTLCDVERNEKKTEKKKEHKNKERTRLVEAKTKRRKTVQTSVPKKVGSKRRGKQPTSSPEGDSYSQHLSVITIDDHYKQGKHRFTPTAGRIKNTKNHH